MITCYLSEIAVVIFSLRLFFSFLQPMSLPFGALLALVSLFVPGSRRFLVIRELKARTQVVKLAASIFCALVAKRFKYFSRSSNAGSAVSACLSWALAVTTAATGVTFLLAPCAWAKF